MTAPVTINGDTNVLFFQPTNDPADPAQICNTASDFRSLISAMYQGRGGVITINDLAVSATSPASTNVNISAGTGIVPGTTATNQESYMVNNNNIKVLSPPGPPQNANRYDLIVLAVLDGQINGNHLYEWQIQCLSGSESANPSIPAVPNDAIPLANIIRRPGQANINAADITSMRTVVSILQNAPPDITSRSWQQQGGNYGAGTVYFPQPASLPGYWTYTPSSGLFTAQKQGLFSLSGHLNSASATNFGLIMRPQGQTWNLNQNRVGNWGGGGDAHLLCEQYLNVNETMQMTGYAAAALAMNVRFTMAYFPEIR
jgi:hypothetical protein